MVTLPAGVTAIPETLKATLKGLDTTSPFLGSEKSTDWAKADWQTNAKKASAKYGVNFV